jgi:hypothetical protein
MNVDTVDKFCIDDNTPIKILRLKSLKSQSFKKRAVYWYFDATLNIFSQIRLF